MDYPVTTGQWRTPGGHLVTMYYRVGTNDWNTLTASLDEDEYHLPRGIPGVGVDIGGYLGSVGIALALDNPAMRVFIVEPVPDNLDLIRANIAETDIGTRIHVIPGAVGRDGEHVTVSYRYRGPDALEHHAFVGNASIAQGIDAEHDERVYPALGLARLLELTGPIDFLKIDCEGGEFDFLHGDLTQVHVIVGEAHAVGGHKGGDVVALLEATHDVTIEGDPDGTCGFRAVLRA